MSNEKMTAEQAIEQITLTLWGAGSKPNLEDLVESVRGLKMINRDFLEQRHELHGKAKAYDDIVVALAPFREGETVLERVEGMRDRCGVIEESERVGLARKAVFLPMDLDLQTADLITSFAENLGQRLVYKQREGYGGWMNDDWRDDCLRRLHTATKPLDVAAFAVFAWYHDWIGSYEALLGQTSVVHNHTVTINVEGNVSGFELSGLLANRHQDAESEPTGFRTEPKKPVEVDFTGVECLIPHSDGRVYMRQQDVEDAVRLAGAVVKVIEAEPEGFRTEPAVDLFRRIANTGAVDDALRELVSDSTDENGVLVVQAVYNALQREGKIR